METTWKMFHPVSMIDHVMHSSTTVYALAPNKRGLRSIVLHAK